jgi:hypothetical protein
MIPIIGNNCTEIFRYERYKLLLVTVYVSSYYTKITPSYSLILSSNSISSHIMIHPNPLKLVVMQRVIPDSDDPDGSPQNPRLGVVYLNLAEYIVGKGSVERKYLLKESKTNSVLKVSFVLSRSELFQVTNLFFCQVQVNHRARVCQRRDQLHCTASSQRRDPERNYRISR